MILRLEFHQASKARSPAQPLRLDHSSGALHQIHHRQPCRLHHALTLRADFVPHPQFSITSSRRHAELARVMALTLPAVERAGSRRRDAQDLDVLVLSRANSMDRSARRHTLPVDNDLRALSMPSMAKRPQSRRVARRRSRPRSLRCCGWRRRPPRRCRVRPLNTPRRVERRAGSAQVCGRGVRTSQASSGETDHAPWTADGSPSRCGAGTTRPAEHAAKLPCRWFEVSHARR